MEYKDIYTLIDYIQEREIQECTNQMISSSARDINSLMNVKNYGGEHINNLITQAREQIICKYSNLKKEIKNIEYNHIKKLLKNGEISEIIHISCDVLKILTSHKII
jgi:hypothetical protein